MKRLVAEGQFGRSGFRSAPCWRKSMAVAGPAALLLLLLFIVWPARTGPFSKYICSPVPRSVQILSFKSNDWLAANPEPVCYLAFTASADDLATVIRQGGFRRTSTNESVPVPPGPAGWVTADQLGPN